MYIDKEEILRQIARKNIRSRRKNMEATKKNADTVNAILELLKEGEYTVQEAYSILDFTKGRIKYTSKVGADKLVFPE